MTFLVYRITNLTNGKLYFGYTNQTLEGRWNDHLRSAYHRNSTQLLHKAIRKYGEKLFDMKVEQIFATNEDAVACEIKLIALYETNVCRHRDGIGYNMTDGGDGGCGYKHTEETICFLREKARRQRHTEDTKRKISEANKGKYISLEQRKIISDTHRGKKLTDGHKRALSIAASRKNANLTSEDRQKLKDNAATARRVVQLDTDGNVIARFKQIEHAAAATGVGRSNISSVCRGRTKTAGGFVWVYDD